MADPFTIIGTIASIISLVEVSDKVIRRLDEYRKAGDELPPAFAHVSGQLPLLVDILKKSDQGVQSGDIDQDTRKALAPNLEGCRRQVDKLDEILTKLAPESKDRTFKRFGKGVRSLWKESDVREIDEQIQRYVSTLTLYCAWSSSNLDPRNRPSHTHVWCNGELNRLQMNI